MNINYDNNKRPKLNIPRSNLEKVMDIMSILAVITTWTYLIVSWGNLPSKVPTHFDFLGNIDSWGGKGSLLLLPIIMTILYIFLTVISKFPQCFNYPVNITEKNAKSQYQNARTFISLLKTEIIVVFLYLEWKSIQIAATKSSGLGSWFLIIFLIVLFGTLGFYIHKMSKVK